MKERLDVIISRQSEIARICGTKLSELHVTHDEYRELQTEMQAIQRFSVPLSDDGEPLYDRIYYRGIQIIDG